MKTHKVSESKFDPRYILVYGPSGIGKTTLASQLKGNVLLLDCEAGVSAIRKATNSIEVIPLSEDDDKKSLTEEERFDRFKKFCAFVAEPETKKKYDTIFIDSLTELSQNIFKHFEARYDGFKVWGEYASAMVDLLKYFRDLQHYQVIFTALETATEVDGSLIYSPNVGGKKAKEAILPVFDEVFRMIADNEKKRFFITQPTAKTQAKDRSGALEPLEPADLGVILEKIKKEKK